MTPVLPAFAGHVPADLKDIYPDEEIMKTGSWGGFDDRYGTYYLHPQSPLFAKIQRLFIEKQTELFGTDHIYGIDAFNEVDSPDWSTSFLSKVGRSIYSSLSSVDPQARWLMMAWLFYYDKKHWTPERIEAFLTAVPQDRLILLDYFCDKTELWRETQAFHGQPYIWCYLGNFGGNTWLCGHLQDTYDKLQKAWDSPTPPAGIGGTLEALDVNMVAHEYTLSQAWTPAPTPQEWVTNWARMRGGVQDAKVIEAWKLLESGPYRHPSTGSQSVLIHATPSLQGFSGWSTVPTYGYSDLDLAQAWHLLLTAKVDLTPAHQYDIVNVGRQLLGNLFIAYRDSLAAAYESKDLPRTRLCARQMMQLISDYDTLLSYDPHFLLSTWLRYAREMGAGDEALADYYERNARSIITVWGESGKQLRDYANRGWSGLVKSFYAPRWQLFADALITSLEQRSPFDEAAFKAQIHNFEEEWRRSTSPIEYTVPTRPLKEYALQLYDTYFASMHGESH